MTPKKSMYRKYILFQKKTIKNMWANINAFMKMERVMLEGNFEDGEKSGIFSEYHETVSLHAKSTM